MPPPADSKPTPLLLRAAFIKWLAEQGTSAFLTDAVGQLHAAAAEAKRPPADDDEAETLMDNRPLRSVLSKVEQKQASPPMTPPKRVPPITSGDLLAAPQSMSTPPRSPAPSRTPSRRTSPRLGGSGTRRANTPRKPASPARFYFPNGVPLSPNSKDRVGHLMEDIFGGNPINEDEFVRATVEICGFSSYCNLALFRKCRAEMPIAPDMKEACVSRDAFSTVYTREIERFDPPTRLHRLLRQDNARTLVRDDFRVVVQEIVNRHPGLEFLQATPEFQLRYAQTVVARIFYQVDSAGKEQISVGDLRRSNLLRMLSLLDEEEDINKLNDYFSYEHFYVIYCKFWELDTDHDGLVNVDDMMQYDDFALTPRIVERIVAGCGRPLLSGAPGKMNYLDFVVFLISEVDKSLQPSLNYWFNVVDVDGDGIISRFELEYFFQEQQPRLQSLSQEPVFFADILCQMIDMIKPERVPSSAAAGLTDEGGFSRRDLRRSKMCPLFFDMLFNMNKFVMYEQRDPVRIRHEHATPELTAWDRWAVAGYFALAGVEQQQPDQQLSPELEEVHLELESDGRHLFDNGMVALSDENKDLNGINMGSAMTGGFQINV